MTLAGGAPGNKGGVILENVTLSGPGSATATTGLQIGSSGIGLSGGTIKNVGISSFGTGLSTYSSANTYLNTFINLHLIANGTGATLGGESNTWVGGVMGSNVVTGASCSTPAQNTFTGTSFDDNAVGISVSDPNCRITLNSAHFENAGLAVGSDSSYISQSAGTISLFGSDGFNDDLTAGSTPQMASISGGILIYEGTVCIPAGRTVTNIFNLSGSATAVLRPTLLSTSVCSASPSGTNRVVFNSSYAGGLVVSDPIFAGTITNFTTVQSNTPSIQLNGTETSGVNWKLQEVSGNLNLVNASATATRVSLNPGGDLYPAAAGQQLGISSQPWKITANKINQNATQNFAGKCTMSSGTCSQTFTSAYSVIPACTCSWTGTGNLTGILKCTATTSSISPQSTVGSDTAVIAWQCIGNPN